MRLPQLLSAVVLLGGASAARPAFEPCSEPSPPPPPPPPPAAVPAVESGPALAPSTFATSVRDAPASTLPGPLGPLGPLEAPSATPTAGPAGVKLVTVTQTTVVPEAISSSTSSTSPPNKVVTVTRTSVATSVAVVTVTVQPRPLAEPAPSESAPTSFQTSQLVEPSALPPGTAFAEPTPSLNHHPLGQEDQDRSNHSGTQNGIDLDQETYKHRVVDHHNYHRFNHSSPPIEWDDDLAASALKLARTCIFGHNTEIDGGGYGQNIGAGIPPSKISSTITDGFYNAEFNYFAPYFGQDTPSTIDDPELGVKYLHLSQVVWASTTHVGCATFTCPDVIGKLSSNIPPYYTVCNYRPAGNVIGHFAENVGDPLSEFTISYTVDMSPEEIDLIESAPPFPPGFPPGAPHIPLKK